jgi:hypothetical protein
MSVSLRPLLDPVHAVRRYANASLGWKKALSELIDNAFDANSTRVDIEILKGSIAISDDGVGMPDPAVLLTLHASQKHVSTRLGRWGVGGIQALLWMGGERATMQVTTTHDDVQRTLRADYGRMLDSGVFDAPDPRVGIGGQGTNIRVSWDYRSRQLNAKLLQNVLRELAYTYSYALERGRTISVTFNNETVSVDVFRRPALSHEIAHEIDLGGRKAILAAGVVAIGEPNPYPGVHYRYDFRVIESDASWPTRLYAEVSVGDGWELSQNKDEVAFADELRAAVGGLLEPLAVIAEEDEIRLESHLFESRINDRLNLMLGTTAKAKRLPKHNESGAITPVESGQEHKRAQRTQPGGRMRSSGGYAIKFARQGDQGRIARVNGRACIFDLDVDVVRRWREDANEDVFITSAIALFLGSPDERGNGRLQLQPLEEALYVYWRDMRES